METDRILEIKLKLFENNLDLIQENILDLINDYNNNHSKLSHETVEYCKNNETIRKVCIDFFPFIFASILNKNINDQEDL
jgi:hypothetical protein